MEKSLFRQYVDKWFLPLILKVVATINGSENPLTYLHKRMLTRVYSPTMKWGSLGSNGRAVAADVVSLNTSLPLKKRDVIKKAEGDIPKLGMKLYLDEKTLSELDILEAQNIDGRLDNQILRLLFSDTRKCIEGIDEQLEGMFLQALSSGVTSITDENNTGTGIRLDFGIPGSNKFGVSAPWSGASANPIDDIENVTSKARAKGHTIRFIKMDRGTFNAFRKHDQVKQMFAAGIGFSGASIPVPNFQQVNDAIGSAYGISIEIIDRTITYEKNGTDVSVNPWTKNAVAFLTSDQVGSLTWSRLAEMNHPAKQVTYGTADEFKLISKYHKVDPLREFTSGQAIVVPVLDAVESIYLLDSEEADASTDDQIEGDEFYTYDGTSYTKQSVVDGLNATNEVAVATIGQADSTLSNKINKLSEEGITTFKSKLVEGAPV